MENPKIPFYHFSIDDVFDSLIEVSDSSSNFFSNSFFKFLDTIHSKYNANVDLYCFYQKSIKNKFRTLSDVSDKHKEIFANNPWLHLGPHALDYESAPHAQTPDQQMKIFDSIYTEIKRFSGNPSTCQFVRLHYFTESYELSSYFQTKQVHSLFTTDKPAIAYRLNDSIKSELRSHGYTNYNNIRFIRSHIRIENLIDKNFSNKEIINLLEHHLTLHKFITFFTHETEFNNPETARIIEFILNYFKEHNIMSI